jgi:hypothetical protein
MLVDGIQDRHASCLLVDWIEDWSSPEIRGLEAHPGWCINAEHNKVLVSEQAEKSVTDQVLNEFPGRREVS